MAINSLKTKINRDENTQKAKFATAFKVTIVAILIGAIGSGVWDLIAKPGLSKFGNLFLTIFTLGSNKIRDYAYSAAASDPSPIAPLIILFCFSFLPIFLALYVWKNEFADEIYESRFEKKYYGWNEEEILKDLEINIKKNSKHIRRISLLLISSSLLLFVYGQVGMSVLNQGVYISRAFKTNIIICAPYIDDQEEEVLWSEFSRVKTKNSYLEIDAKLNEISKKYNVNLVDINLW